MPAMTQGRCTLFALTGVLAISGALGCKDKDKSPAASGSAVAASPAEKDSPAAALEPAEIVVDGETVAKLTVADAVNWKRVDDLLPQAVRDTAEWKSIKVTNKRNRVLQLDDPKSTQAGRTAMLYPGQQQMLAFGMFDEAELKSKGAPRTVYVDVIKLEIETREGRRQAPAPEQPTIRATLNMTINGAKLAVTTGDLQKLPKITAPVGDTETPGWNLKDIIGLQGDVKFEKVLVLSEGAPPVEVSAADVANADILGFFKLNRQGVLRFRMYKRAGGSWDTLHELRGVTQITVE